MTRKILKYISILLLALLGLFLLLAFALTIPKVQTAVTHQITKKLSETLQAKVRIQSVDIEFFKTAVLKGIYIEDQKEDTLLYADRLAADIGIFSLLQKNIFLNTVDLYGAKIKFVRTTADSTFNFDFLLKAFQPTSDKVVATASPWKFSLGGVAIKNAQISYLDEWTATDLKVDIPFLNTVAKKIDFNQQIIDLKKIRLESAVIDYQLLKGEKVSETSKVSSTLSFPEIGWDITDYTYRDIEVNGKLAQKNFDGRINLADKNAKLTFNGQANLQDSIPDFNFVLVLATREYSL